MKWIGIIVGIVIGAFLESTFFHVPFVLIILLLTVIFIQKPWIIFLSIPAGFLLDSLAFRVIGESSLFFAVMMGIFFAYGKKFELESLGFMVFASGLTSLVYFLIFGSETIVIQTGLSIGVGIILFILLSFLTERFSSSKPHYLGL